MPTPTHINYNHTTNLYEIREGNTTYAMDLKYIEYLKMFMKTYSRKSLAEWYSGLGDMTRKKIIISEIKQVV